MTTSKIFSFGLETLLSYRSLGFATCVFLSLSVAGLPPLIAQEQDTAAKTHDISITAVPAPLGGTSPQLLPTSQGEVHNVLRGGVTMGALYDDNAVIANTQGSEYQYSISPSLAVQQTRPHTAWSLDYRGGFTIEHTPLETGFSVQNATSATADLQHLFSPRLLLELREDYIRTNVLFGYTNETQSIAALSGAGQLNSFIAIPAATRTVDVSTGNLTYQLTRHSSMGFSGSYSVQRFRDVAVAPGVALSLIDTRTATGRGFYALELGQRNKIGLEYQLQDLRFQGNLARTVDQTVFLFDEVALTTNMTLTLYAGPDHAHAHNNILLLGSNQSTSVVQLVNDNLSPAGGAMFTWRGKFVALRLSGQRVITDGSGSTGAVRSTNASAELRKDFTNRWNVGLRYLYSDGRLLVDAANAGNSRITFHQGSLILERRLSERLVVRGLYTRLQQGGTGNPAPLTTGNHNRVGVELAYQFARPLGR
jgi:hypothetical protein